MHITVNPLAGAGRESWWDRFTCCAELVNLYRTSCGLRTSAERDWFSVFDLAGSRLELCCEST
jgi:hypothetical protein